MKNKTPNRVRHPTTTNKATESPSGDGAEAVNDSLESPTLESPQGQDLLTVESNIKIEVASEGDYGQPALEQLPDITSKTQSDLQAQAETTGNPTGVQQSETDGISMGD